MHPKYFLARAHEADRVRLNAAQLASFNDRVTAAMNSLVPACAVRTDTKTPPCLRYLHPTKGWKQVGGKRFALALQRFT
jgi:hypothetical protein